MLENCFYRISIKGLIYDENGKILLCKESNGLWEFPGGGLDFEETAENCIKREIKEEMGLEVIFSSKNPKYFISFRSDRTETIYVANIFYEVKVKNLNFTKSEECEEIGFFSIEEMKTLKAFSNILEFTKLFDEK